MNKNKPPLCSSLLEKLRRSAMIIATSPAHNTAKLRRSGMELMYLDDLCRSRSTRSGTCRYGAFAFALGNRNHQH